MASDSRQNLETGSQGLDERGDVGTDVTVVPPYYGPQGYVQALGDFGALIVLAAVAIWVGVQSYRNQQLEAKQERQEYREERAEYLRFLRETVDTQRAAQERQNQEFMGIIGSLTEAIRDLETWIRGKHGN